LRRDVFEEPCARHERGPGFLRHRVEGPGWCAAGIVHGIGKIAEAIVEPQTKTFEWVRDENGIVMGATVL